MDRCKSEYNRMNKELLKLQEKIRNCPKGSIRKRTFKGREYCYLQYRDGKHIRSLYVKRSEVESLKIEIETRRKLEESARKLQSRLNSYAKLIGIHRTYRPVKNVDYEQYTLFMSTVSHDYKKMDPDDFLRKYDVSKYRGLNKRYLAGYLDYINGIDRQNVRKTNDLILDPYTYLMYYKYGNKEVLEEELKSAIPVFLSRGLLITNVQEAVNGAFDK
ncbi:MAG: hypothetical protein IJ075_06000 [Lachnospiraceae bacterium]|nr:hypothetical protein [Lachnospiraceae bacterium]MBQ9607470.1 hypothetical protein [Lachnospiraceae bacterium]MBR1523171.1 hypothetical protein [Lachnospiraceae bacterium]